MAKPFHRLDFWVCCLNISNCAPVIVNFNSSNIWRWFECLRLCGIVMILNLQICISFNPHAWENCKQSCTGLLHRRLFLTILKHYSSKKSHVLCRGLKDWNAFSEVFFIVKYFSRCNKVFKLGFADFCRDLFLEYIEIMEEMQSWPCATT